MGARVYIHHHHLERWWWTNYAKGTRYTHTQTTTHTEWCTHNLTHTSTHTTTQIHPHTKTHTQINTTPTQKTHTHIHRHIYTHTHKHVHTHILPTQMRTHILYVSKQTNTEYTFTTNAQIHNFCTYYTQIHTSAYTKRRIKHTHKHMYTHTRTHTHTHILQSSIQSLMTKANKLWICEWWMNGRGENVCLPVHTTIQVGFNLSHLIDTRKKSWRAFGASRQTILTTNQPLSYQLWNDQPTNQPSAVE